VSLPSSLFAFVHEQRKTAFLEHARIIDMTVFDKQKRRFRHTVAHDFPPSRYARVLRVIWQTACQVSRKGCTAKTCLSDCLEMLRVARAPARYLTRTHQVTPPTARLPNIHETPPRDIRHPTARISRPRPSHFFPQILDRSPLDCYSTPSWLRVILTPSL
jgi:hypothetical protein